MQGWKYFKAMIAVFSVCMLAGCGAPPSPYAKGKSAADIPANVNVVVLREVAIAGGGSQPNGDPKPDPSPSENDREVAVVAKQNIIGQLTNFGYRTVETPGVRGDISLRFYIGYIPERWPLIGRIVSVTGIIDDADGSTLYKTSAMQKHEHGLISAVGGDSRDEMVSAAAREAVVNLVKEIQKGTKNATMLVPAGTAAPAIAAPAAAPTMAIVPAVASPAAVVPTTVPAAVPAPASQPAEPQMVPAWAPAPGAAAPTYHP